MSRTYGPPRRKNTVGAPPPEKWWGRHARHRFTVRIPVADIADDWKAIAGHYIITSPYRLPRWAWRHRDHELAPILTVAAPFTGAVVFGYVTPLPMVVDAILGALAAAGFTLLTLHKVDGAATERRVLETQKTLRNKINGLTVHAVQVRDHATTIVASVAPGLDPEAYDAQKSVLASSFRSPVTITKDTPGRLELRLEHEDLLARQADWNDDDEVHPDRIPIGHDWDGQPFTAALAHQSWLVAGVRGGGKSAFLNALCARLMTLPNVLPYLIDPLEGVDLGIWHKLVVDRGGEVVTSVGGGLDLLVTMEQLRADRVRLMTEGRHPVQLARWGKRWPMRVLVIDELADLTTKGNKIQRDGTAELLRSLVAKGRKSNDVVIAATQHPSATIIPQIVRAQFTNVLGLRVGRREQTRQIFGDGMVGDWDLSAISATQPGRGIWSDGSSMTPVRTAGLWGAQLRRVAKSLAESATPELQSATDPSVSREGERPIVDFSADLQLASAERIRSVLPIAGDGLSVAQIVDLTKVPERTVYYHLRDNRKPWVVDAGYGRYRRAA